MTQQSMDKIGRRFHPLLVRLSPLGQRASTTSAPQSNLRSCHPSASARQVGACRIYPSSRLGAVSRHIYVRADGMRLQHTHVAPSSSGRGDHVNSRRPNISILGTGHLYQVRSLFQHQGRDQPGDLEIVEFLRGDDQHSRTGHRSFGGHGQHHGEDRRPIRALGGHLRHGDTTSAAPPPLRVLVSLAVIHGSQFVDTAYETAQFVATGTYSSRSPLIRDLTDQVSRQSSALGSHKLARQEVNFYRYTFQTPQNRYPTVTTDLKLLAQGGWESPRLVRTTLQRFF
jgi:hypothetical protein